MKRIDIPGVGLVDFPEDMTDDEIGNVIQTQILKTSAAKPAEPKGFISSAIDDIKKAITPKSKYKSVMDGMDGTVVDYRPEIQRRGAPVTDEAFKAVKSRYENATPQQRNEMVSRGDWVGNVAGEVDKTYHKITQDGLGDKRKEARIGKVMKETNAEFKTAKNIVEGGFENDLHTLDNAIPERDVVDYSVDTVRAIAKIAPQTAKMGVDTVNIFTNYVPVVGDLVMSMGEGLQEAIDYQTSQQSPELRQKTFEMQEIVKNGSREQLTQFLFDNPSVVSDIAIPSLGFMFASGAIGKKAGEVATNKVKAKLNANFAGRNQDAINRLASQYGNKRATQAAIGVNVGANAGGAFEEAEGDARTKYTAAGIAGLTTILGGKLTKGGAEGALARTQTSKLGNIASKGANVAQVAGKEMLQEYIEGGGQALGVQTGEYAFGDRESINWGQIDRQGILEASAAAGPGAMAGISTSKDKSTRENLNRQSELAIEGIGRADNVDDAIALATEALQVPLTNESEGGLNVGTGDTATELAAGTTELGDNQSQGIIGSILSGRGSASVPAAELDSATQLNGSNQQANALGVASAQQQSDLDLLNQVNSRFEQPTEVENEPLGNSEQLPTEVVGNTDIDQKANEAATSPLNDLPEPTQAQKDAGNYKVGRIKVGGLNISVENPDQSTRKGIDRDGKAWESTMNGHYGYVKGVVARAPDKEHVDVNVKPNTTEDYAGDVFIINQNEPTTGKFDEPKAYIGYDSKEEAEAAYRSNYADDWQGLDSIAQVPMTKFKEMLNDEMAFLKPVKAQSAKPKKTISKKVLTYEAEEELAAKRYQEQSAQETTETLEQAFTEDELNAELDKANAKLREAGYDENETKTLATEFKPSDTEASAGSGAGNEAGQQAQARNEVTETPRGNGKGQERERVRPIVEAIVKRRAAANQIGKSKPFDDYLQAAKDFMAGKEIKPTRFKLASVSFQNDKPLSDAYAQLAELAKQPAKQARNEVAETLQGYRDLIDQTDSVNALRAIVRDIQDETVLSDAQVQELDDLVMDKIDALAQPEVEDVAESETEANAETATVSTTEQAGNVETENVTFNGFEIYKVKTSSGDMWAVQSVENKAKGVVKGFGNALEETLDDAKQTAIRQLADYEQKQKEKSDAEKELAEKNKQEELAKAEIRNLEGFADGFPDVQQRRIEEILNKPASLNGVVKTRRQHIKDMVNAGRSVKEVRGERILEAADGYYFDESAITKTGMDFAEYLIGKRENFTIAGETNAEILAREQAQKDAEAEKAKAEAKAKADAEREDAKRRMEAQAGNVDNFTMGENSREAAKPQRDMFGGTNNTVTLPEQGADKAVSFSRSGRNQADDVRDMFAQHNISEEGLFNADKIGGLAVPSLAVTKADLPLENFGEITLIAPKTLIDPKGRSGAKVFGADIYSPRYPEVTYQFSKKSIDSLTEQLKDSYEATESRPIRGDDLDRNAVRTLKDEIAVKHAFLKSVGEDATVVYKEQSAEQKAMLEHPALKPFVGGSTDPYDLTNNKDFVNAYFEYLKDKRKAEGRDTVDGDFERKQNIVRTDGAYAFREAVNSSKTEVDKQRTRHEFDKVIEAKYMADFNDYAQRLFSRLSPDEKLFEGYTYSGNRRYSPHTLDNVVKKLKKDLRGGEGWNYGLGSVRSKFTPEFKSIAEIKKNKDRIVSTDDFEAVKAEQDAEMMELADKLSQYHFNSSKFGYLDSVTGAMAEASTMGVKKALEEYQFKNVPIEIQQDFAEFLTKLRNMPTEYFEAKVTRAVGLNEFIGAVVPDKLSKKALDILKRNGIENVYTYSRTDGNRADVIKKALNDLNDVAMFSRAQAPVFYSQLSKAISEAKQDTWPAQQWKQWLLSNAGKLGVKKDEIQWTGVTDWLELQTGKVSKADIQAYLDGNGVQVTETMIGGNRLKYKGLPNDWYAEQEKNGSWTVFDGNGDEYVTDSDSEDDAISEARDKIESESIDTKYSQYTVPGGENYKELLLTLPLPKTPQEEFASIAQMKEFLSKANRPDLDGMSDIEKLKTLNKERRKAGEQTKPYQSSHFDQPNILAHVRFDERTDADGNKVLFINEVQSDWGQEGKKKGFKQPVDESRIREMTERDKELSGSDTGVMMQMPNGTWGWMKSREFAIDWLSNNTGSTTPTAPFVTDTKAWVSLAIKRMMRYAVDNGFDKVAINLGEVSNEWYDLSKQVDMVEYWPKAEVLIAQKDGNDVIKQRYVSKDQLPDIIGKEVAKKLLETNISDGAHILRGEGLSVGGEGMIAFYSQILPQTINDVLKKVSGGKVESLRLNADVRDPQNPTTEKVARGELPVPSFTITPEMREKVAGGLPLFSKGTGTGTLLVDEAERIIKDAGISIKVDIYPTMMDAPIYVQRQAFSEGATGVEGFFDTRTNRVAVVLENIKTDKRLIEVVRHEVIGHYGLENMLNDADPILLNKLLTRVHLQVKSGNNKVLNDLFEYVLKTQPGLKVRASDTQEQAKEKKRRVAKEVIAVMAERNMQNDIVKRVLDAIRKFFKKIGLYKGDVSDAEIASLLRDAQRYLNANGRSYVTPDLVASYSNRIDAMASFSVTSETKESYENRIDELFKTPEDIDRSKLGELKVLDIGDVLDVVGFGGLPVYVHEAHAIDDGRYNHPLTKAQWKKMPQWLDNPALVLERTKDGNITIIAPEKTKDGKAIVIGLKPEVSKDRFGNQDRHLVLTAFPKDRGVMNIDSQIESGDIKPLYADTKIAPAFYRGSGLNYATQSNKLRSYNRSLKTDKDLVKYRASLSNSLPNNIPDTITVNGIQRPTLNSNGKPIHPTREGIENFWRWFGDSKVVDEQGRPLVVYHGSKERFDIFRTDGINRLAFFTDNKDVAKDYGKKLTEAYLKIEDLESVDFYGNWWKDNYGQAERLVGRVNQGFTDGLLYENTKDPKIFDSEKEYPESNIYAVKNPSFIKSAIGNNGNFDGNNDSILFSRQAPQNLPPEETKAQAAQRAMQDKFNRFKVLNNWLAENGSPVSEEADVYLAETVMSSRVAARKQDFREDFVEPLIKETQESGINMEQVGDFLKVQHAPEANKRARELHGKEDATAYGVSDAEAKRLMNEFKQLPIYADLNRIANKWRSVTEMTKKIKLESGLLPDDMVKAWEDTYEVYVPVKGRDTEASSGLGKGLHVNGKIKQRLGHELRDEAIIENMLRDHEAAIVLDEKNRVGKALIKFAMEVSNGAIVTIDKPVKRQVLKKGESAYMVNYYGSDVATFPTKQEAEFYVTQMQAKGGDAAGLEIVKTTDPVRVMLQASPMLADNEVNVYVAGHAIRIQINDEVAAKEYKNMGVEHLNTILSASREVNNWLSKAYTGYSPDFIFTNPVRDATQGAITLTARHGVGMAGKVFARYPNAVKELVKHFSNKGSSPLVNAYRANGGQTGAAYMSDLERIGNDIQDAYNEYQGMLKTYQNTYDQAIAEGKSASMARLKASAKSGIVGFKKVPIAGHFLRLMERVNSVTENALRLATYDALTQSGFSQKKAAAEAKELMNFNRKGEQANVIGSLYLFYNPSVQGTKLMYEALFDSPHKNQARALTGMMALGAMALSALAMSGDDEDKKRWEQTPDYVKDSNVIFYNGETQVTITLPYGYKLFWTLGNVIADAQQGKDLDKLCIRMAASVFENLSPFGNPVHSESGLYQLLPTVPKMALAPGVNEDSFGMPITPKRWNNATPDSQLMNRATHGSVYDAVAEKLNDVTGGNKYQAGYVDVSPETLKFWVKSLTGGTGQFVFDSADITRLAVQGVPPKDVKNIPVVRRFVRESQLPDARAAFYERKKEADLAAAQFSSARSAHDAEAVAELAKETGPLRSMAKVASRFTKMANAKRDLIVSIKNDETLTAKEKDLQIKAIEKEELAVYEKFNKLFDTRVK